MGVFKLFQYHSERGVNLESTWGSLILAASLLGFPCQVIESHVSFDLVGPGSGMLKMVSGLAPLFAVGLLGLWAVMRRCPVRSVAGGRHGDFERQRHGTVACLFVLLHDLAVAPGYVVRRCIFPPSWIRWSLFAAACAVILAVSSWIWPSHYATGLARLEQLRVELCIFAVLAWAGALLLTVSFFTKYPIRTPRPA